MALTLDNLMMRRLWLDTNGLLSPAVAPLDVLGIIKKLGFVQLDSIQNVSRAHHHILWSRHHQYRPPMLDDLLRSRQHIFEHFTHDAAVLPMDMYPMWQRKFTRLKTKLAESSYHNPARVREWKDLLINRITAEGPLSTKDFAHKSPEKKKKTWSPPPHKQVLDYLWYTGALATSHREKFIKFYDLTERVIPAPLQEVGLSDAEQIDWLCRAALDRLAVGSLKEIKAFWEAKDITDVKAWVEAHKKDLLPVRWQTDTGEWMTSYALRDIETRLQKMSSPSTQIKIINPFDPAVRDRGRLKRLFGFDYKLEVFVPAARRKWGYYVYPLLQGDRFVGRLEAKADRENGRLNVLNLWPEQGLQWNASHQKKLQTELNRFARLADLKEVHWAAENMA